MTEKAKPVFRIEAIPESAPRLPDEIHKPSSSREEYKPKTWTGMLAYERIQKGYKAFAGGGDLTGQLFSHLMDSFWDVPVANTPVFFPSADLWESYVEGSVTYFAGNMPNLNRYPRPTKEFWPVFFTLAKHGLKVEVPVSTVFDDSVGGQRLCSNIVYPTQSFVMCGYAFATSNNSYTTHSGTSWSGNSLNRMKYDESGRIYDQAFFYEDLKGIDKITGELFELQDVKDDLWEMFGRRF
ncbi:hypothetical protein HDU93_002878 [Gonapodya sp. JEL0774]|nr:hypothetical protein HDU93_002878 [Gonapodya sp. JEL0774]